MRERNRWWQGLLLGLLVGLGLGAAVGLLFAPEKGRKTRRELARRAEHLGDKAADVVGSAEELFEAGRRRLAS